MLSYIRLQHYMSKSNKHYWSKMKGFGDLDYLIALHTIGYGGWACESKHQHLLIRVTGSDWPSLKCFLFVSFFSLRANCRTRRYCNNPLRARCEWPNEKDVCASGNSVRLCKLFRWPRGTLRLKQQPQQRHPHDSLPNPHSRSETTQATT
jgi:hypothetical protein